MARWTATLLRDERGATAVEYGLIISLIVIVMITTLVEVANTTTAMWDDVSNKVETAGQP